MRAPSLRHRVIATGVLVVLATLLLVNALLFVVMRRELRDDRRQLLEERAALAGSLVADLDAHEVIARLSASGIPARAVLPGDDIETEAFVEVADDRLFRDSVPLAEVGHVEVAVSLADVDAALRQLLLLGGLGTVFGVCLAALILLRASRQALEPLEIVVSTAKAIARGRTGERLRPDRSDSDIGRLAAAFDEMLDAEEVALEQAQQSSRLSQQFLADAAHQLRTPIAGIRASAELLSMNGSSADRDRLLANLTSSTERIGLLVDALLRMARLDQGRPPATAPADLLTVCREEVDRVNATAKEISVALVTDGGSYDTVAVDRASIREAFANVIDNAIRYARTRVEVEVRTADDGSIVVTVSDDGKGMDTGTAERAFERFATFGAGHGAGLGLPIARGIAEAHGGELVYEDGSFVFRLPAGDTGQR